MKKTYIYYILNCLISERGADGWEPVTYDHTAISTQIKGAFVITFDFQ